MNKILSYFFLLFYILNFICLLEQKSFAESPATRVAKFKNVSIPEGQDRFVPFGVTVRAGGSVTWTNNDGEEHVVKSDDFFNTVKERKIDHFLVGTGANNGKPGTYTLTFAKPGQFIYYCSLHAKLDNKNQPISKMQDGSAPMMGVVTVVP